MPPVVGILWYSPQDWDSIGEEMADPEAFDHPYQEWLEHANKSYQDLLDLGTMAYRIPFRSEEFLAWCRENNRPPDADARANYSAFKVAEIHG